LRNESVSECGFPYTKTRNQKAVQRTAEKRKKILLKTKTVYSITKYKLNGSRFLCLAGQGEGSHPFVPVNYATVVDL